MSQTYFARARIFGARNIQIMYLLARLYTVNVVTGVSEVRMRARFNVHVNIPLGDINIL